MKYLKKSLILCMVFSIVFSMFASIPNVKAATHNVYIVKYKCPVRLSPDENASVIKNGNDTVYVYPDQELEYISSALGTNNGLKNQTWYAVKFDYAARGYSGYVAKACMYDPKSYSYSDETEFEESINSFPESYKVYLRRLHAMYPNWSFKADMVNIDFNEAAEAESQKGTSAISYLYPSLIFKDSSNPNGIIVDGTSWYAPCRDAVKYYMDPRNFLSEKSIFMFESLSYNSKEDSTIQKLLDGSFMEGTYTENGVTKTYAETFIEAAKKYNISSSFLASRSLLEMGTTMSAAASGKTAGYEGYYNFYNIGAYSGADNYLKGLQYAKDNGWNSIEKAIYGGADVISSNYINKGQDTTYYQKFNVASYKKYNTFTHQYQTNIMAPQTEASIVYNTYKSNNKLANSYTFVIPVYNNMPSSAFKVSTTDTVGGTEEKKEEEKNEKDNDNSEKEEVKKVEPEEKIKNAGYNMNNGYISGILYKSDISVLRGKLTMQGALIGTSDSSFKSKTSGKIATGDKIEVDGKTYTAVIYGDLSGDGEITIKDLLLVQKFLLSSQSLDSAYKEAADVSKDGKITIKDLLLVQKYLLGSGSITQ